MWLAPIGMGIGADLVKRRSVHPVYLIGVGAVMFLKFLRRPLAETEAWHGFVSWLASFYV